MMMGRFGPRRSGHIGWNEGGSSAEIEDRSESRGRAAEANSAGVCLRRMDDLKFDAREMEEQAREIETEQKKGEEEGARGGK